MLVFATDAEARQETVQKKLSSGKRLAVKSVNYIYPVWCIAYILKRPMLSNKWKRYLLTEDLIQLLWKAMERLH